MGQPVLKKLVHASITLYIMLAFLAFASAEYEKQTDKRCYTLAAGGLVDAVEFDTKAKAEAACTAINTEYKKRGTSNNLCTGFSLIYCLEPGATGMIKGKRITGRSYKLCRSDVKSTRLGSCAFMADKGEGMSVKDMAAGMTAHTDPAKQYEADSKQQYAAAQKAKSHYRHKSHYAPGDKASKLKSAADKQKKPMSEAGKLRAERYYEGIHKATCTAQAGNYNSGLEAMKACNADNDCVAVAKECKKKGGRKRRSKYYNCSITDKEAKGYKFCVMDKKDPKEE